MQSKATFASLNACGVHIADLLHARCWPLRAHAWHQCDHSEAREVIRNVLNVLAPWPLQGRRKNLIVELPRLPTQFWSRRTPTPIAKQSRLVSSGPSPCKGAKVALDATFKSMSAKEGKTYAADYTGHCQAAVSAAPEVKAAAAGGSLCTTELSSVSGQAALPHSKRYYSLDPSSDCMAQGASCRRRCGHHGSECSMASCRLQMQAMRLVAVNSRYATCAGWSSAVTVQSRYS